MKDLKYIDFDKVAIILCTKNGEKFLKNQLNSLKLQTFDQYELFISDDGSTDLTIKVISEFEFENPDILIHLLDGPQAGFASNFISTLSKISQLSKTDFSYYAFCDQDDVWDEIKLEAALKKLSRTNLNNPSLYCGRTRYIDSKGMEVGHSPDFKKKPSFENALVQSIAGGNTMVFNKASYALLLNIDVKENIVSHDWLLYLLVTANNGQVIYDRNPYISYRQHEDNIIGSNNSFSQILKRLKFMLNGTYSLWVKSNLNHINSDKLSENKIITIKAFGLLESKNIFKRFKGLFLSKIYRQTTFGTITLIASTALKKIL
jgi:glycosyltransferase involved in cell wall biosynthesis